MNSAKMNDLRRSHGETSSKSFKLGEIRFQLLHNTEYFQVDGKRAAWPRKVKKQAMFETFKLLANTGVLLYLVAQQ